MRTRCRKKARRCSGRAAGPWTPTRPAPARGDRRVRGSAFNDSLTGNGSANNPDGSQGNDILVGGSGNDILIGGSAPTHLPGGGVGADRFVFQRGDVGNGVDNITDFTVGAGGDVLDISDLLVGAGISPTDFVGAESNYLIVMPGANTTIAFDADGVGGAAAVQIATLTGVNTNLPALLSAGQIDRTP